MKRKMLISVVTFFFLVSAGNLFAQTYNGVALGLGYTANAYQSRWAGGMVTFHVPGSPLVFDLYPYIGANGFGLTLTGDLWLVRNPISGLFAWYLGPGLWIDFGIGSQFALGAGARLAVGLQLWLVQRFELFLEAAPGIGIIILPQIDFAWPVPISIGFRWWF